MWSSPLVHLIDYLKVAATDSGNLSCKPLHSTLIMKKSILSLLGLVLLVLAATARSANAQIVPTQVQCASQFGQGNMADQFVLSALTGSYVPVYSHQCIGQIGNGNSATQSILNLPYGSGLIPGFPVTGYGNIPGLGVPGQGIIQNGNGNWASLQQLNLSIPGATLNMPTASSRAIANPTVFNSNTNNNYLIGH
jgi:hypothetical protein